MGCLASKRDINDIHSNVFSVLSVDEQGHRRVEGHIEVTDTCLVLFQKGRSPIRWPLKCLRRYGFETEVFSFESGRRCPTGPGIYAFRCNRAQQLFNVLQSHVQNPEVGVNPNGSGHDASLDRLQQQQRLLSNNTSLSSNVRLQNRPGFGSTLTEGGGRRIAAGRTAGRDSRSVDSLNEESLRRDYGDDDAEDQQPDQEGASNDADEVVAAADFLVVTSPTASLGHLYQNINPAAVAAVHPTSGPLPDDPVAHHRGPPPNPCLRSASQDLFDVNFLPATTPGMAADPGIPASLGNLSSRRGAVPPALNLSSFSGAAPGTLVSREYQNVSMMDPSSGCPWTDGGEPVLPPKPTRHASGASIPVTPGNSLYPVSSPPFSGGVESISQAWANGDTARVPSIPDADTTKRLLNYAQLDLNQRSGPGDPPRSYSDHPAGHQGQVPCSSSHKASNNEEDDLELVEEYATIDFDRTKALTNTARLQNQRQLDSPSPDVTTPASAFSITKRTKLHSLALTDFTSAVSVGAQSIIGVGSISLKRSSVISN